MRGLRRRRLRIWRAVRSLSKVFLQAHIEHHWHGFLLLLVLVLRKISALKIIREETHRYNCYDT